MHTSIHQAYRIQDGFRMASFKPYRMASLLDQFILMQYMAVGTILLLSLRNMHTNSNHVFTLISMSGLRFTSVFFTIIIYSNFSSNCKPSAPR